MPLIITDKEPLFSLGQVVATPGAQKALEDAEQGPEEFLVRHVTGDWGLVSEEDKQENEYAVANGLRILSSYMTNQGVKLWVISEHDRSVTTILTPLEY